MKPSERLVKGFNFKILIVTTLVVGSQSCNFGPGNLGLLNYGAGNVGILNFGVGNLGLGNKGFLNAGALSTGFAQVGLRNIGALNVLPVPNTISVANIPVGINFTPPIGRRRRRSTLKYPEGKFPWLGNNLQDKKVSHLTPNSEK